MVLLHFDSDSDSDCGLLTKSDSDSDSWLVAMSDSDSDSDFEPARLKPIHLEERLR